MADFLLIMTLGFLGSFGHCVGMCGPLAVAFSLAQKRPDQQWYQQFLFHLCLNGGRLTSYIVVGGVIGGLGSVLVGGGQMAGIDSALRQGLAIITGLLLMWLGLSQINPQLLPQVPFFHPLLQIHIHQRLVAVMDKIAQQAGWGMPLALGLLWGLIPCGFLYTAQVKAAETGDLWQGAEIMLAFGVGTLPPMLGIGVSATRLSVDRRSQLFQLGGWVTLAIGILTLVRSSQMVDYTGHAALVCLMLALVARPLNCLWSVLLRYRRALGVAAFVLSLAHTLQMLDHALDWNLEAISFMLPLHQVGMGAGILAVTMMLPMAITSSDRWIKRLGQHWRQLHLLGIPALLLCATHAILLGSHYFGGLQWTLAHWIRASSLAGVVVVVLLLRSRLIWQLLALERFYTQPNPQQRN